MAGRQLRMNKEITGEWLRVPGGLVSVALGALLVAQPAKGARAVLWLIGLHAALFGVLLVVLAFKARRVGTQLANA